MVNIINNKPMNKYYCYPLKKEMMLNMITITQLLNSKARIQIQMVDTLTKCPLLPAHL